MNASVSISHRSGESAEPLVYIVDDDAGMNDALADLLSSIGMRSRSFLSADAFLTAPVDDAPGCVVLDVRLRGNNGLEVQRELKRRCVDLPVVFITGHGDIEMTVRAMKAGAVDFLAKPFRDQDFIDAVTQAIAVDRCKRQALRCGGDLRARFGTLSEREREVMMLASSGLMNKQIAGKIGISEVTVKIHRRRAMRKMGARTFADLVKMTLELDLSPHRNAPAPAVRNDLEAVAQLMASY